VPGGPQALLGFTSEAHWLRYARKHLAGMFPYLPQQSGYNKRLRAGLGLVKRVIRLLARSGDFWLDACWIVDSTPVPCGMSRPTVQRSELAGWAGYGYCASHSRFFWGLRLYLVCTLRLTRLRTYSSGHVGEATPRERRWVWTPGGEPVL
jgi:hypothetical protein